MLFLHETHEVVGKREDDFETAIRDEWMPTLAETDYARLLYFARRAHGTGMSYRIVTVTAVADAAAWGELDRRVRGGDLQSWMRKLDELRYDVTGKLLVPVHWSPLQEVDLDAVPTDGRSHEPSLFMQDTGWPYSPLDDYIQAWHDIYYVPMQKAPEDRRLLDIQACFQVAHGTHHRNEAVLWQKIVNHQGLLGLLTREVAEEHKQPGSYMHDALEYRDQWESQLLRTASWSPWH